MQIGSFEISSYLENLNIVEEPRVSALLIRLQNISLLQRPAQKVFLHISQDALEVCSDENSKSRVSVNLRAGSNHYRRLQGGGRQQSLAKAIGLNKKLNLDVVDLTAGFAADSFVLASLGAQVTMIERSYLLGVMIKDALELAQKIDDGLTKIVNSMRLETMDAKDWLLSRDDSSVDVSYLDPMFPVRGKKAAVKKDMQFLHWLHSVELSNEHQRKQDESELLEIALKKSLYRAVVKRPAHAEPIQGPEPSYSLKGKTIRYDVYTKNKIV